MIYPSAGSLASTFGHLWIMLRTFVGTVMHRHMFPFFLDIFLGRAMQDDMVNTFTFWRNVRLFFRKAAAFSIPVTACDISKFSPLFQTCNYLSLDICHSEDRTWRNFIWYWFSSLQWLIKFCITYYWIPCLHYTQDYWNIDHRHFAYSFNSGCMS